MKKIIKVFKALSDPTRLRIVFLLTEKDLCVCELVFILKMEQSLISHHLRILRDADVVADRREGKWIIYKIPPALRKDLQPLLDRLVGGKFQEHKGRLKDLTRLEVCLRQEVRRQRGAAAKIYSRRPRPFASADSVKKRRKNS